MPYFRVSLLKSASPALRTRTSMPCFHSGALALSSCARTSGSRGASRAPARKHARPTTTTCTRLDIAAPRSKGASGDAPVHRPGRGGGARTGRFTPAVLTALRPGPQEKVATAGPPSTPRPAPPGAGPPEDDDLLLTSA